MFIAKRGMLLVVTSSYVVLIHFSTPFTRISAMFFSLSAISCRIADSGLRGAFKCGTILEIMIRSAHPFMIWNIHQEVKRKSK